jgi:hypothetical protein
MFAIVKENEGLYTHPFIPKMQKPTRLCLSFFKAAYPENITLALLRVKQSHFHILYEYAAAAQKIKRNRLQKLSF